MNVNECNFFYSEERNHCRFDCSRLTDTAYCNNFAVVIEGCIGEMEEFVLIWQWVCQKRRNVTL
jgi:hypothetical protein